MKDPYSRAPKGYGEADNPGRAPEVADTSKVLDRPPYASSGTRVAAFLVDGLLFSVLAIHLSIWLGVPHALFRDVAYAPESIRFGLSAPVARFLSKQGVAIFGVFYAWAFTVAFGGTLGKLALGIRVVDYEFRKIGAAQAAKRGAVQLFSFICALVPYLKMVKDPRVQAPHDHAASTYVVRRSHVRPRGSVTKDRTQ